MLPPMEWIERAIRIDSITHHSNEEMVRFLAPLLEETGLKVEEQKVVEGKETFKNLIAYNATPDAADLLVMNTHLDTVGFGDRNDWTKTGGDPFKVTRVRDRLYGLGTADVKLDFLCKIWAARHAKPWARPFALVGTYGEERGLVGAKELLERKRVRPKYALVGEPSNLELIYAHKGHLLVTVALDLGGGAGASSAKATRKQWRGKSAHSSTPQLGDNAILKALNDCFKRGNGIVRLTGGTGSNLVPDRCEADVVPTQTEGTRRLFAFTQLLEEAQRDLKRRRDSRFSPSVATVSLNLARMTGNEVELAFDVRLLPETDASRLKERLGRAIETLGGRIVAMSHDVALKGRKTGPLMKAATRALKACGVPVVAKTKASSTEAALYNQHGAEAIVFGPGLSIGNVHRPNEHNLLSQMAVATRFYQNMLSTAPGAT